MSLICCTFSVVHAEELLLGVLLLTVQAVMGMLSLQQAGLWGPL